MHFFLVVEFEPLFCFLQNILPHSQARKLQPVIIFIDEIDSFLRSRASQDHEATAMMKAQFMTLWDGLITDNSCEVRYHLPMIFQPIRMLTWLYSRHFCYIFGRICIYGHIVPIVQCNA